MTVVGTGGVGKTRMAIELGPRVGRVRLRLAGLTRREPSTSRVDRRRARGVPAARRAPEVSSRATSPAASTLLILDNFEHVLDAAPLVADLLAARAGPEGRRYEPRAAARSRRAGVFPLAPLDDAVELFLQIARARDPPSHPMPGTWA